MTDFFKGQKGAAAGAVGSCSHFNTKALDAISVKWKIWFPHSTCFLIGEMGNSLSKSPVLLAGHGPAAAGLGKATVLTFQMRKQRLRVVL